MASCDSIQQIFEKNPLPKNPSFIDSLSQWNQIKSIKPIEVSSVTEIFGELHFKENSEFLSSSSSSQSSLSSSLKDFNSQSKNAKQEYKHQYPGCFKKCDGFSSNNSGSLHLCTEGLGVESFDGIEEPMIEKGDNWEDRKINFTNHHQSSNNSRHEQFRKSSRTCDRSFPPPISCIGRSGKPLISFQSHRQDGRFVLKEIRVPTQELLHAFREDGRLTLHFVRPEQEILEDEDYAEEEEMDAGKTDEDDSDNDDNVNKDEIQNIDAQKTDNEIDEHIVEV